MKAKFLLFFLIFTLSCAVSKNPANIYDVVKKEYAGTVVSSVYINVPFDNYTIINTEISTIPVDGKIKITVGTKCYYYYLKNKDGVEITMLIWEGSEKGYTVR
jgi:hypothetical protein